MRQPITTLCSLALLLWGYQTGVWMLAIPMVLFLEARDFIRPRWSLSLRQLKAVHVLGGLIWLGSILYLPTHSPTPLDYAAHYHLLKSLPIAFFPLLVCQTYCTHFSQQYQALLRDIPWLQTPINVYYPYFGICLIAASATGGNGFWFMATVVGLVVALLGSLRSPRFSSQRFLKLVGFALILSILGTHQFYWLRSHVQIGRPAMLTSWIQSLALPTWLQPPFEGQTLEEGMQQRPPDFFWEDSPGAGRSQTQRSSNRADRPSSDTDLSPPARRDNRSAPASEEASPREGTAQSTAEGPPNLNTPNLNDPNLNDPNPNRETTPSTFPSEVPAPASPASGAAAIPEVPDRLPSTADPVPPGPGALPPQIQQAAGMVNPETARTQIGNVGSLQRSDALLFRVTPSPDAAGTALFPLHLREAVYNQYQGGAWTAVDSKFVPPRLAPRRWLLGPRINPTAEIRVSMQASPPTDLLKLPLGTVEISALHGATLAQNQYGTVAVQGQPPAVDYRVQFDPTRSLDSPPTPWDRLIPATEQNTLRTLAQSLQLQDQSDAAILQAISAFFQSEFQYSLDLPAATASKTPLASFLLDHRSGHCEYFASATTLLLRAAGIPARYVVGYLVHEYDGQQYLVRLRDAHAWVVAYVDGHWRTVDTTPGGGIEAGERRTPAAAESPASNLQEAQTERPRQRSWDLSQAWSHLKAQIAKGGPAQAGFMGLIGVALILLLFALYLMTRLRRHPGRRSPQGSRPRGRSRSAQPQAMEPEFHHIEQRLRQWGLPRREAEPVMQWIQTLEPQIPAAMMQDLRGMAALHYRDRFDPQGLSKAERQQLKARIRQWLDQYPPAPRPCGVTPHS
ncbi:transglutaminase domain-containing protein [Lyngbya confervoides]|uniref:Transglutaminase-like domain-containing protein n=1 Tax=Lyngbya confervoides BDU141951 TaxID=1574623 RepID=A0ABD4T577_9CYAN|nr:transglutaminase domain-containing protein [Lyngbya confervoides]MCM1983625.1 hypothetical protein [Lyngbya confervoides BDU141951]